MARIVTVGAAQLGPIARSETRAQVVERMLALMRDAKRHGCDLIVFPELALTTFFPRWYFEQQSEVDAFFERAMPGPETQPLFDVARRLGIIGEKVTAEQAHPLLTELAGPEDAAQVYAAHVDFVRHGRRICHARRPACGECPLAGMCPSAGLA